jgi:hypothetical protein
MSASGFVRRGVMSARSYVHLVFFGIRMSRQFLDGNRLRRTNQYSTIITIAIKRSLVVCCVFDLEKTSIRNGRNCTPPRVLLSTSSSTIKTCSCQ